MTTGPFLPYGLRTWRRSVTVSVEEGALPLMMSVKVAQ
jgi:hypothetical protein